MIKRLYYLPVCIALMFLSQTTVYSQSLQASKVKIKNAIIPVTNNVQNWLSGTLDKNTVGTKLQVLVHLTRIASTDDKVSLRNAGVDIQDFVTDRTYTAIITLPASASQSLPAVLYGITDILPAWKVNGRINTQSKERVKILVSFCNNITDIDAKAVIKLIGGVVEDDVLSAVHAYEVDIPANKVMELAGHYSVSAITSKSQDIPLNFESRTAARDNIATLATMYGGYGLSGKGVVVGVGDNVSGNCHIDLKDRIINYNSMPYNYHGVHVNGIVGGAGIIDPKGEGVAPGVTIVDQVYNAIWARTNIYYPLYNMTVTNNSYAAVIKDCNYAGTYDGYAVAVDRTALDYDTVLHVFAAGNDGELSCAPYPAGFATMAGGYQPAKNNIVVTSTDKEYVNSIAGSRGPIKDGRLKPDISAVGIDIFSTTNTEEYLIATGTSMASPGVTGALALLTERYKQLHGNVNPQADVLKAVALNGATDLGNPGPDFSYGFGFLNTYRSLQIIDNNRIVRQSIKNGGQKSITITVPPNTAKLKVMLYWHDVPASALATTTLVNDLDLEVTEPSNTVHKPLVLDPDPVNILNDAVEKEDRLNNVEQVTIYNPTNGAHKITVNGFRVTTDTQAYVITYDFESIGVNLTYPTKGAQVKADDTLRVYWEASDNANPFTLEYSTDGGGSWKLIDNNIPADRRWYKWGVPFLSTGTCRMRVTRNNTGQQSVSGLFVVNPQQTVSLDGTQCPGYIRINWTSVPSATGYEVMMKRGPAMQVMATTNATTYTFSGLSMDSIYYVAVRPVLNNMSGYRSIAVKRQPNDGNCAGNISDNDIMVQRILKPTTGRIGTSSELKNNETLSVLVRNLDDAPVNSYSVSYSLNGGAWQSQAFSSAIPAGGTASANISGIDLSTAGNYTFKVAVTNTAATDPVKANDTTVITIKQLNNFPINITPYYITHLTNFENWPVIETVNNGIGLADADSRWDYTNASDSCRLRSFINSYVAVTGSRSIALDAIYNFGKEHRNDFLGTYNMSNYDVTNDEVRMEFNYILHGRPYFSDSNYVAVRGKDTDPWQTIFTIDKNAGATGKVYNSGSLSITDGLLALGQKFSPSTQVDFVQNDISLICDRAIGNGLSIDDVKLYTVQNDIQLIKVVSPMNVECGVTGDIPFTIQVRNGVNQTLNNVQLYYQYDGGSVVNETLASIAGKQTVTYTFNQKLDMSNKGEHTISVWAVADGDTYHPNDSVMNYKVHNEPLINSFPYKENFESNDGYWYSDGVLNSWQYGAPASTKINKAASGSNAWKTNLKGNYNSLELSYLYSPCFDIGTLGYPTVKFKGAYDIEYCGAVLCDAAAMEYSTDGVNWIKIKEDGGKNWYTDTSYNIWSGEKTDWTSYKSRIPSGIQKVQFRYVFTADPGVEKEGLAIDDVEVFDDVPVPAENNLLSITPNPTRDGNLKIEWSAEAGAELGLVFYNLSGKVLHKSTTPSVAGYNGMYLQTPHFSSGVYFVRINIGNKHFTRKIVYL
ncbi:MAG: S8 family serine peptidase [Bacteroidetes bacterium]|nr:S8 family serine peptidase [Bacteroidota bacterium]